MKLLSLTVAGYKNLTMPLTFGPLEAMNALHGPNNAGKSNLLGAIDLFFRVLGVGSHVSKDQFVSMDEGEQIEGYPFAEIFHAVSAEPIQWQATLSVPDDELRGAGIEPECSSDPCTLSLELSPVPSGAQLRVTQFQLGNLDVARESTSHTGYAQSLRAYIAGTFFMDRSVRPFGLLDPYRLGPEDSENSGLVPQRVRDALFDARQSLDRTQRSRWALFVQLMRELEPELGPGQFDTAFDRATGRANLVYDAGQSAMAIDRLGAGVQRMAALLGSLALAPASLIGFAEPELGLSPSLQQRLRRAFRGVLTASVGPSQLFFTTHSPVLAAGDTAFALEALDGVPVIEQRPCEGGSALPPLPDLAATGSSAPAGPADLDSLIGLVDQLAEMEPQALVAAVPAAKPPTSNGQPAEDGQPGPDPADTPPWKWQPKK